MSRTIIARATAAISKTTSIFTDKVYAAAQPAHSAPAGQTDQFVEGVQLRLLDAYQAFDDIWQSVDERADGSIGGWMLRQQRLGLTMKGGEFTVTLPWEQNGKKS